MSLMKSAHIDNVPTVSLALLGTMGTKLNDSLPCKERGLQQPISSTYFVLGPLCVLFNPHDNPE